jgi:hypothetical protein
MKNDIEGSFIPIKTCDLILPPDFKPEETQVFQTKLKPKKQPDSKPTETPKILKKSSSQKTSKEPDPFSEAGSKTSKTKNFPFQKVENPKPTAQIRPFTAKKNPLPENLGKTTLERTEEETQKQNAREFVTSWLDKSEKVRKAEVEKIENLPKFQRFDNKLSEEISELIKKIENTRKSANNSIKNMRKTLDSPGQVYPKDKFLLSQNPFKSFYPPNVRKELKSAEVRPGLDLRALYSNEFQFSMKKEVDVVSDDEDFVKNIDLDD